ncbi:MAG: hypothetical protein K2R93_08865 [Gemmatimonadaceae bacterium]|nr:hypothetical protein [Gemmatimonadaceae bacterium]
MSQSIFLLNASNELSELEEQAFLSEASLQELLARYPALLGTATDESAPRRWLLVSREVGVPDELDGSSRWSLDHLFLDEYGVPTLIEVKRASDLRIRREVVGQMLDYAANAVAYWPVERVRSEYENRCVRDGVDPSDTLQGTFGEALGGVDAFWQQVKTNLQAGRIRLVFVADRIPRELRRIVEFLNQQMDPAEVLAIELRQYAASGMTTIIPTVIGQTAEAAQRKGAGSNGATQWTEESFFAALSRTDSAAIPVARALVDWGMKNHARFWWGQGKTAGSCFPVIDANGLSYQIFGLWTTGAMEVQFQWLARKPEFADESARESIAAELNAIVPNSIPPGALRRRPSIKLNAFTSPEKLEAL